MGRTSKRQSAGKGSDTPASAAKNQKSRQYKAGIYARLSADIDKKICRQTSKNESVEVQIEIAKKFIEEWNGNIRIKSKLQTVISTWERREPILTGVRFSG